MLLFQIRRISKHVFLIESDNVKIPFSLFPIEKYKSIITRAVRRSNSFFFLGSRWAER